MRIRAFFWAAVVVTVVVLAPRSMAQDLYDNGPTDGYTLGWTINFGFAVSDQFTLHAEAELFDVQFAAWLFPGDVLQTAELSITSSEFGGTSYFDQTVNFSASGCFSNGGGFNICTETGDLRPILNAGTYWLNLSNAVVNSGDPVYWDMNSGPSLASDSYFGTIPSESFTIGGLGGPPPTSPEPSSLLLLGSGLATLLGWLRVFRGK